MLEATETSFEESGDGDSWYMSGIDTILSFCTKLHRCAITLSSLERVDSFLSPVTISQRHSSTRPALPLIV